MLRRSPGPAVLVVLLTTAFSGTLVAAGSPGAAATDDDPVVRAAQRYDVSATALRTRLADDPTLRIDAAGRAFFVDRGPGPGELSPSRGAAPAYPLAQTFQLHSRPGSQRTIYLDFDGHTVSGTGWNGSEEGLVPDGSHPGWDPAGNGAAFTDSERALVQDIFQRVAEDFAPFDVDVTTQDPGNAAINRTGSGDQRYGTRALITPSAAALDGICGGPCGGISYIDNFDHFPGKGGFAETHSDFQPSWIFPQTLQDDAKAIAEATSHEVGHTLGLEHDGTSTQDYYEGHDSWGPIMGESYHRPVSQWALSNYPDARLGGPSVDPAKLFQTDPDDISTMAGNGIPIRGDEAGRTVAAAAPLPAAPAYISTRSDVDVFALGDCAGPVTVDADPAAVSPNLDLALALLRADGSTVATADPASARLDRDRASGLDASLTETVPEAAYLVRVDGVGRGTARASYNDYGSVGAYTLAVTGCDLSPVPPEPEPPAALADRPTIRKVRPGARGGARTATIVWAPPGNAGPAGVDGYQVRAFRLRGRRVVRRLDSPWRDADDRRFKFDARLAQRYQFAVRARGEAGVGPWSRRSRAVRLR